MLCYCLLNIVKQRWMTSPLVSWLLFKFYTFALKEFFIATVTFDDTPLRLVHGFAIKLLCDNSCKRHILNESWIIGIKIWILRDLSLKWIQSKIEPSGELTTKQWIQTYFGLMKLKIKSTVAQISDFFSFYVLQLLKCFASLALDGHYSPLLILSILVQHLVQLIS